MEYLEIETRGKLIRKATMVGGSIHLFFALLKVVVGIESNNPAIIADGTESFIEAAALFVIYLGIRFTNKKPDRQHPMGYGRMELISDFIIGFATMYASFSALLHAGKDIIHPIPVEHDFMAILIVASSIPVKLLLSKYEETIGEEASSNALILSGHHTGHSVYLSITVVLTILLQYKYPNIMPEGYVGVAVSISSMYFAFNMVKGTIRSILGSRVDTNTTKAIKETICKTEGVLGAYDLNVHDYGNGMQIGSVHIEVPSTYDALELDHMQREIFRNVRMEHNLILEGIGIYARDDHDPIAKKVREIVVPMIENDPCIINMHGLVVNHKTKAIYFDIVVSFDAKKDCIQHIKEEVQRNFSDYSVTIIEDIDL